MALAWYMYPSDSPGGGYGETTDPLSTRYKKPDSNVQVPNGVAITSWDSGIITDVSDKGGSAGGLSVTMQLSHPVNSQARYASFNYLGSATVHVGQQITAGQQIGIAGSPYGILFALALNNGPSWPGPGFPQGTGNPAFDPRIVLNALQKGQIPSGTGLFQGLSLSLTSGSNWTGQAFVSVANTTHEILNNIPGFVGIVDAIDSAESFVPFKIQNSGGQDIGIIGHLPFIGGIAQGAANQITLPADTMQALLVFVTANTMAAIIRFIIIMTGVVILIALVMNAIGTTIEETTGQSAGSMAATGIKLAALAA